MILKCDCCGFAEDFVDEEDAFQKGWDAPPHFTGYVTCSLCPAATQFMDGGWARHAPIHERWEREGRPAEFSQETCLLPEDAIPEEKIEAIKALIAETADMTVEERIRHFFKAKEEGRL